MATMGTNLAEQRANIGLSSNLQAVQMNQASNAAFANLIGQYIGKETG